MSNYFDIYNQWGTINGSSIKEQYQQNLQALVNQSFENSSTVLTIQSIDRNTFVSNDMVTRVTRASKTKNITLNCSEDDIREIIFKDISYKPLLGDTFYFENNYWIVINTDNINSPTSSCTVRRCNNQLKYNYNGLNFIQNCSIEEIGRNTMQLQQDGSLIMSPNSYFIAIVPNNYNTKKVPFNSRFILGSLVYRVIGFDDISMIGLIKLKLQLDDIRVGLDDFKNGYADNSLLKTHNYSLSTTNGDISAKVGDNSIQLITILKDNNVQVQSSVTDFIYTSSDTNICMVSSDGKVSFVSQGSTSINITLKTDNSITSTVNVSVSSVIADNYSINIAGSSSLILNGQGTYNGSVLNNGIVDNSKVIIWSVSDLNNNPTTLASIINSTGNSCTIKANNSNLKGTIILKGVLSTDSNIVKTMNITIKSAF